MFKTYDEFKEFVNNMEVNKKYEIENFRYDSMEVELVFVGEFSWTLHPNFKILGSVGWVFPMKNANYVKRFKTVAGAKRNLIKYLELYFTHKKEG